MITSIQLLKKRIDELTFEEMAFVHLSTNNSPIFVKDYQLRSTLSFIYQNICHALVNEASKQLMPYLSLCAVLDQLGICYDRKDKIKPRYSNGIKRALVNFSELDEDDKLIDVLYALRNGLLHNLSLTSFDKYKNKFYKFRYNSEIEDIYQDAEIEWNGNYVTLDTDPEKYTTHINVEKLQALVFGSIDKANDLNQNSLLELRLEGGLRQLYFDYVRAVRIE